MQSWWEFGEWSGTEGKDPYYHLECAFCTQRGKFSIEADHAKTEPNGRKVLNYDVASCTNCGNLTAVFWTVSKLAGEEASAYRAAADRVHETCEMALDQTQPITVEDWIFLEISHAALADDLGLLDCVVAKVEVEIESRALRS